MAVVATEREPRPVRVALANGADVALEDTSTVLDDFAYVVAAS